MAYFVKKTKNKKGTYLQVYESYWDPDRRQTRHRSHHPIGYVHELVERGTGDPVADAQAEVDRLNAERRRSLQLERASEIGESTPMRHLGHFAAKAVWSGLGCERDLGYLQLVTGFRLGVPDLLRDLVCARIVSPCPESRTFHDVIPLLGEEPAYSLDQLYEGIEFLGSQSDKVVEILNARVDSLLERDTTVSFFDCTNFYFEIDREDDLRRKGPSKENRKDPIVGLALLLDAGCLPRNFGVYPGNESEKPKLREQIAGLKEACGIKGRTVRVADKGLNCADNVVDAVMSGDGYLFSKSVRQLPERELAWVLSDEGWEDHLGDDGKVDHRTKSQVGDFEYTVTDARGKRKRVKLPERRVVTFNASLRRKQLREIARQVEKARNLRLAGAKRGEYGDSAKFVQFVAVSREGEVSDDAVAATLDHDAIKRARSLAGYNMLVTSEIMMPDSAIYDTYHGLWRIEETFRVMKTELEARPVYLQKHDSIVGHFLVCYVAALLTRLLQFEVLGGEFGSEQLFEFMRGFQAVRVSDRKYLNVSRNSKVVRALREKTGLPLTLYNLSKSQYKEILSYKFDLGKPAA